jgi:hypothetical protein
MHFHTPPLLWRKRRYNPNLLQRRNTAEIASIWNLFLHPRPDRPARQPVGKRSSRPAPARHGPFGSECDLPLSSLRRAVAAGNYPAGWEGGEEALREFGEESEA